MSSADEIYAVSLGKNIVAEALTKENEAFYKQLAFGEVKERRVKTAARGRTTTRTGGALLRSP